MYNFLFFIFYVVILCLKENFFKLFFITTLLFHEPFLVKSVFYIILDNNQYETINTKIMLITLK